MAIAEKQKTDWKAYEQERPKISIRISRSDKQNLDAALQMRGESISDLIMAYLRPIITEGTPDGQRAHEIISTAIQASIAWNKAQANGGFGDTTAIMDEQGKQKMEEWHSPEINVCPRITKSGEHVLYHMITQRAGMSRQDAIRRHVAAMLDAWSDLPESERDVFLREISNPEQHRFVIAYSGFQHWVRFAEAHEMLLHQSRHQTPNVQRAANMNEQLFMQWANKYLMDGLTKQLRSRGKGAKGLESVVLYEGQRDDESGTLFTQSFSHYEIDSDASNVEKWVGLWLNEYRQLREGLEHETAINELSKQRIIARLLRIDNE